MLTVCYCHCLHLGTSPDALGRCDCYYGEGVLEIKCPFSGEEAELYKLKNSFLRLYFSQVQGQLNMQHCVHMTCCVDTTMNIG